MSDYLGEENVVSDEMAEIFRNKTPGEKLRMMNDMWKFAQRLIRAKVRQEYPDWTEEQINKETASRMSHGAV